MSCDVSCAGSLVKVAAIQNNLYRLELAHVITADLRDPTLAFKHKFNLDVRQAGTLGFGRHRLSP